VMPLASRSPRGSVPRACASPGSCLTVGMFP
jgi:hypothetical protein